MALLADGWHMATHAAALGIAALAYLFARQHARNSHFTFGTGKFGDLAAFSSAIILALIAVQIAYESVVRLIHPVPIAYGEAIAVAVLGLAVNLVSAWLLRDDHDHHHGHGHAHYDHDQRTPSSPRQQFARGLCPCDGRCRDLGAGHRGAGGRDVSQWVWADPVVGIVGSVVIASWAYGLIRASGAVLLDVNAGQESRNGHPRPDRDQGRPRHRSASVAGRPRPSRRGDLGRLR